MSIPEFDANVYRPLIEVVVFEDAHFARTADLLHIKREGGADLPDQRVKLRLPLISDFFNSVIQLRQGVPYFPESCSQTIDLFLPCLEVFDDTTITFVHQLQPRLLAVNFAFQLISCLAFGHGVQEGAKLLVCLVAQKI